MASFLFRPLPCLAGLMLLLGLGACSPPFNWREVRPDNTTLAALLPCKPDKASKSVPLAGRPTELSMLGCDAGGATFALAYADIGDAAQAAEVLARWQAATLANMQGSAVGATPPAPLLLPGATIAPLVVSSRGKRADGSAVESRAAYFARGSQVFQAVIYASRIDNEAAETFFSGLRLP